MPRPRLSVADRVYVLDRGRIVYARARPPRCATTRARRKQLLGSLSDDRAAPRPSRTCARSTRAGWPTRRVDLPLARRLRRVERPAIVGVMGPNGSGKTTLFELITGSNEPTAGRVICCRPRHPSRAATASATGSRSTTTSPTRCGTSASACRPSCSQRRGSDYPLVHLFDEPQFNTQDGYIGFMLDFFRKLRGEGRLVFVCLHPTARYHLEILQEICERFMFVEGGRVTSAADFNTLLADERARRYLGDLATNI